MFNMDLIPTIVGGMAGGFAGFAYGSEVGQDIFVRSVLGAPIHVVDAAAQQGHLAGGIVGSIMGGAVGGTAIGAVLGVLDPEDCEL